jgi:hypothetical protein
MSVSRKNKSMKKSSRSSRSSKRSKNIRKNKKTRKHMRKMRGGGQPLNAIEQTVDFIIYCGDSKDDFEVLVSPNENVVDVGETNNLALIGTFATASLGFDSEGKKIPHLQSGDIKDGIKAAIDNDNVNLLTPLSTENALKLLLKDLKLKKVNITDEITDEITDIVSKLAPLIINGISFQPMTGDVRMTKSKDTCTTYPDSPCNIQTQLFAIKVPEDKKNLFENDQLRWMQFNKGDNNMFSGHKKLITDSLETIFSSGSGEGYGSGFGYGPGFGPESVEEGTEQVEEGTEPVKRKKSLAIKKHPWFQKYGNLNRT